jgi:hypothetical protein
MMPPPPKTQLVGEANEGRRLTNGRWGHDRDRAFREKAPSGATDTIRMGDRTPKGYQLAHFEDAFTRYLPQGGA